MLINVEDVRIGLIYKYTSPAGKIYIGQTMKEGQRKNQHKNETSKTDTKFGRALQKYGYDNFEYKVLIKFKPTIELEKLVRVLNYLEKRLILSHNSYLEGYNLTTGGDAYLMAEETKEKIREAALNMTEEHKVKLSKSAKIRVTRDMQQPEKRKRIMDNLKKGSQLSIAMSDETKKKLSEANNHKKKAVNQYDMEENFIASYDSIASAARSINDEVYKASQKTKSNHIGECIRGIRKSAFKFIWKRI